jgi:hypothetical protein
MCWISLAGTVSSTRTRDVTADTHHWLVASRHLHPTRLSRRQDPLKIAGPVCSLVHGVAALAIGGNLRHVGIHEDPEALVVRAMTEFLTVAQPG